MGKICNNQFIPCNYTFGQRSQDIEPLYYENGLLYISKKELVLDGRILGDTTYSMVVDHIYGSIDIDTKEDFSLAEFYFNNNLNNV
jgi:N-acylneuraminate cytidylyltransferase